MGVVNNPLVVEKGLKAEFQKALNNGEDPKDVMGSILQTSSSSDQEKYGWLGESPMLRVWDDERTLQGLIDNNFTLPNVDYEATLMIDSNQLADDQIGAIKTRIADLAVRAKAHPRKLFFDQLNTGDVDLAYDGVPLFSASHEEGNSGTQSNIVTGTAGPPYTVAQFKADFTSARAVLRGFKDDQAEPRNEGELTLRIFAAQDLESVIDEVIGADLIDTTTNILKGAATKTITSRLSGNDWYLSVESGMLKAIVMQEREGIKFEMFPNGENAFMRKKWPAGVSLRRGFGPGAWYKMVKINN